MENGAASFYTKTFSIFLSLFYNKYTRVMSLKKWNVFSFSSFTSTTKKSAKALEGLSTLCAKEESPCDFGLVCYYDRNFLQSSKK